MVFSHRFICRRERDVLLLQIDSWYFSLCMRSPLFSSGVVSFSQESKQVSGELLRASSLDKLFLSALSAYTFSVAHSPCHPCGTWFLGNSSGFWFSFQFLSWVSPRESCFSSSSSFCCSFFSPHFFPFFIVLCLALRSYHRRTRTRARILSSVHAGARVILRQPSFFPPFPRAIRAAGPYIATGGPAYPVVQFAFSGVQAGALRSVASFGIRNQKATQPSVPFCLLHGIALGKLGKVSVSIWSVFSSATFFSLPICLSLLRFSFSSYLYALFLIFLSVKETGNLPGELSALNTFLYILKACPFSILDTPILALRKKGRCSFFLAFLLLLLFLSFFRSFCFLRLP